MFRPFEIFVEGATIVLSGILRRENGGRPIYDACGQVNPDESVDSGIRWMNGVKIEGRPRTGIKIQVFEIFKDGSREMRPFFAGEGLQKFSSREPIYVVVNNITYTITYHAFPTGKVVFEAGPLQEHFQIPEKSEEIGRFESLNQRMKIPSEIPSDNKSGRKKIQAVEKDPDKPKRKKPNPVEKTGRLNGKEIAEATEEEATAVH